LKKKRGAYYGQDGGQGGVFEQNGRRALLRKKNQKRKNFLATDWTENISAEGKEIRVYEMVRRPTNRKRV